MTNFGAINKREKRPRLTEIVPRVIINPNDRIKMDTVISLKVIQGDFLDAIVIEKGVISKNSAKFINKYGNLFIPSVFFEDNDNLIQALIHVIGEYRKLKSQEQQEEEKV